MVVRTLSVSERSLYSIRGSKAHYCIIVGLLQQVQRFTRFKGTLSDVGDCVTMETVEKSC